MDPVLSVRGLRTQIKPAGGKPVGLDGLRLLAERIRPLRWHVEIHIDVGVITDIDRQLDEFPVPAVIEHMGHMPAEFGLQHEGFQALLRLLRRNDAWVKLSGSYINSAAPSPHQDIRPFVEALLAAAPGRAVWGSNWPHPHQDPVPDDRHLLAAMLSWLNEFDCAHAVLVDNPSRLYDFPTDDDTRRTLP